MSDDDARRLSLALMLLVSTAAGYAFAVALRKARRIFRAEMARRRFTVVRGSLSDDAAIDEIARSLRGE